DAHRLDLVVHLGAQLGLREPDLAAQLLRQTLGLLVEHQEDEFGLATPAPDEVDDLLVLEKVVVDVLDRLKLRMRLFGRAEDVRMAAVIAVDVADVLEVLAPFVDAQKIEVGGRDEIDRILVPVKEAADFRDVVELFSGHFLVSPCPYSAAVASLVICPASASSVKTRKPRSAR